MKNCVMACAIVALAGSTATASLDGSNIQGDAATNGLSLLATQDTPTGFGNNASELNGAWGTLDGGKLKLSITGNLEANFNKMWIFFDGVGGGLNNIPTGGSLSDGGFGEINNLGVTFDSGFTADHGIRIEHGSGFLGIRGFDILDNTAADIWTAGGPTTLVNAAGGLGVTTGWDNSNVDGVTDADASGALTSDTGWEFEIDLATFFGTAGISEVKASIFITNGDGGFFSNQVLGGVGGAGNLAGSPDFSGIAGDQFVSITPAPGSLALLGLGGLAARRRR